MEKEACQPAHSSFRKAQEPSIKPFSFCIILTHSNYMYIILLYVYNKMVS